MQKILNFARQEIVLTISLVLAVLSMAAVPPDGNYPGYIDFRTLSILLSLMSVMCGLRGLGVFSRVGKWMLEKTGSVRSLALVLVMLCFWFSMLITNDVALITFVPFTIEVLTMAGLERYMIVIIVLQTIAANLGSMLTPIGNPQNLYLYSLSGMTLAEFIGLMLPYTLISLVGLIAATWLASGKEKTEVKLAEFPPMSGADRKKTIVYLAMFLLAMTTVARLVPCGVVLAVILAVVFVMDRPMLKEPDYALLCTFTFLFIFIGNMKRIDAVNEWLSAVVQGREIVTSLLASQIISNVPAAILLSGFTDKLNALIVGTNLGGLGTIIASMASLISFKFYGKAASSRKGKYLAVFTVYNLVFLVLLFPAAMLFLK